MKKWYIIGLIGFWGNVFSQNQLMDTVTIPIVSIEAKRIELENELKIDSSFKNDALNQTLADLISKTTPVFVKSYGIGSQATVSLRGSAAAHTAVIWNGISLNSSMNGLVDLALFPSFFFEEASLNLGSSSLATSSGGIGGAIHFDNRAKSNEILVLDQQIGSFGLKQSQIGFNIKHKNFSSKTKLFFKTADNNFTYRDIAKEGFPNKKLENASIHQKGFKQDFYWRNNDKSKYSLQFWYFNSDRELPSIYTVNNVVENQVDQSFKGLLVATYYYGKSILNIKTALIKDELNYQNEAANFATYSNSFSSKSIIELSRDFKRKINVKLSSNIDFNQAEHSAYQSKLYQNRISVYAQIAKKINKKLTVQLASRQEWVLEKTNYFLPSIALDYKIINANLNLFASYGQNLKYPSLNDLYWTPGGNPELKTEQSESKEFGVRFDKKVLDQSIHAKSSISIYHATIDDYILWRPSAFGYWMAFNLNTVESQGLEYQLTLKSLKTKWAKSLFFNYTYSKSATTEKVHEFDKSVGKQLIYIPEHSFNLNLKSNYQNYYLSCNWQFIGARYISSDNKIFLPSYGLIDLSIGKTLLFKSNAIDVGFSVLNVMDIEYQAIQWRPMPGRNYLVQLKYKLNAK